MPKIPFICLTKNRPRMFKAMIDSLERTTDPETYELTVVDNASECPVMQDYLHKLSSKYRVVVNKGNYGIEGVNAGMGKIDTDFFIMSDPDLQFRDNIPYDWIQKLSDVLSSRPDMTKIGTALNITFNIDNLMTRAVNGWERSYWVNQVSIAPIIEDPCYTAFIDTTLCMYRSSIFRGSDNKIKFSQTTGWPTVRVAGRYTVEHLGWDVLREYEEEVKFHGRHCNLLISGTTKFLMENVYSK